MGRSYTIKYVVEVEREKEKRAMAYEMTLGECVMRYATHNNGVKKGEKIRVFEQVGTGNYLLEVKKDIKISENDKKGVLSTNNIEKNNTGITWRNRWIVPRSYYVKHNATHEQVAF